MWFVHCGWQAYHLSAPDPFAQYAEIQILISELQLESMDIWRVTGLCNEWSRYHIAYIKEEKYMKACRKQK